MAQQRDLLNIKECCTKTICKSASKQEALKVKMLRSTIIRLQYNNNNNNLLNSINHNSNFSNKIYNIRSKIHNNNSHRKVEILLQQEVLCIKPIITNHLISKLSKLHR